MTIRQFLPLLLATLLILGCGQAARAQLLQGGVEHSESLPPVDNRLKTGGEFDEHYFDKVQPNNLWVPIPRWLAGVWQTRTETMLKTVDLQSPDQSSFFPRTFPRHDKWIFGMQVDRTGQVWHFINVPSHRKVLFGGGYEYRHETAKEFLYSGEDRVLARYKFVAITVDGETHRITETRQQETQWLFTPGTDGNVRADNSFKTFSPEGVPLALSRNMTPFFRAKAFAPIDIYNGIDMRKSFRDYLLSHNLADRVPSDSANDSQLDKP